MANVGRTVSNTVAKAPITFAMIEFAEPQDCTSRKSTWLNYGFKDVTPKFAAQSAVPTLDGSQATAGRQMIDSLKTVDADWYMLSGHQGAIYGRDYELFTTDGQPLRGDGSNSIDSIRVVNEEQNCGFFNESYHKAYWESVQRSSPTPNATKFPTQIANAIYVRTSPAAPAAVASFSQMNPLLDASHSGVKGIILSACNTLIYKSVRVAWNAAYPNAVIFGTVGRIATGTWVTNAIASCALTDESFWRNPQAVLDQSGNCEKLATQLMQGFPSSSQIGLQYKGTLYYCPHGKSPLTLAAGDSYHTP